MYKAKLQETCQRRYWKPPQYSCLKDGFDHCPRFSASVLVDGISFHSPSACASLKEAYNEAARIAFLHFTPSAVPSPDLSLVTAEATTEKPKEEISDEMDALCIEEDSIYQYKSQLQKFAQRNHLNLPTYSHKSEGLSHAPRYKATVTLDGCTYESLEPFSTLKEAEQAAAKAALKSLLPNQLPEDDSGFYKNLLQKLAQKGGYGIPVYKTMTSGYPHMPTFFSSVAVKGEIFYGKEAGSKKKAHINAAKVAYATLIERGQLNQGEAELSSPAAKEDMAVDYTHCAKTLIPVGPQQSLKSTAISGESIAKEVPKPILGKNSHVVTSTDCQDKFSSPELGSRTKMATEDRAHPLSPPNHDQGSSLFLDFPAPSISDSSKRKTSGRMSNYALCNRFIVYTCFPDIAFPKGIIVLPIAENQWMPVSLEFPNETDNY